VPSAKAGVNAGYMNARSFVVSAPPRTGQTEPAFATRNTKVISSPPLGGEVRRGGCTSFRCPLSQPLPLAGERRKHSSRRYRRHLAEEIAVTRPFRNVQEALAVACLDPRLDGDDLALGRLADRAGHRAAFD